MERAIEAALQESEASGVSGSAVRPSYQGLVSGSCGAQSCDQSQFSRMWRHSLLEL